MRICTNGLASCLLAAVLAIPVVVSGCKTGDTAAHDEQQPSDYMQWEHDTHRQHEDYNKRSAEEQKQYREWQQGKNHQR